MGRRERQLIPGYASLENGTEMTAPNLDIHTYRQRGDTRVITARAPQPIAEVYPELADGADVLFVFGDVISEGFFNKAGVGPVDHLRCAGISAAAVSVTYLDADTVTGVLEHLQPRLVVNRAMCMSAETVATLSVRFPKTQFVTVNHSSQSDLMRCAAWLDNQTAHVRLAATKRNCWYGGVDERNYIGVATGIVRSVVFPNVVRFPGWTAPKAIGDTPVISLTCVSRVLKNIPNQLIALGLVNQERRIVAALCMDKSDDESITGMLDLCGVEYRIDPWTDWDGFMRNTTLNVDIGLQCSFTESFNYVALEQMLCGKPVIGSPAIRYLPEHHQVNPDDPQSIANALIDVIDNYSTASRDALRVSRHVAEISNYNFEWIVTSLLEGNPAPASLKPEEVLV